jgi:hypothetical protein
LKLKKWRRKLHRFKKQRDVTSVNAASTLSGDGIIAGVVAGRYATIIPPIKWFCPNLAFPHLLGFVLIALTTPLDLDKIIHMHR